MSSIFPETTAGGLATRDVSGNPLNPPGVQNSYVPPASFVATCALTALPSDCTARIEPRQINGIVSELVSFAECLDPNGPWDCVSFRNLCNSFNAWVGGYFPPLLAGKVAKVGDTMSGPLVLPGDPTQPLQAVTKQYVDATVGYTKPEIDAKFVLKAGDTMTGDLYLHSNYLIISGSQPTLALNKLSTTGNTNRILGQTNGLHRWLMEFGDTNPEMGSNAGSYFWFYGYDDNGSTVWPVMQIDRQTKKLNQYVATIFSNTTPSSNSTSGAVTISGGLGVGGAINTATGVNITGSWAGNLGMQIFNQGTGVSSQPTLTLKNGAGDSAYIFLTSVANTRPDMLSLQSPAGIDLWAYGSLACTIDTTGIHVSNTFSCPSGSMGAAPFTGFGAVLQIGYLGASSQYGIALRPVTDGTKSILFANAAGTLVGEISQTSTTTTYTTTSDERLKTDLQPFDSGPIVDAIDVFDFAWKTTGERAHGVLAQQAIKIYPEAITHDANHDVWQADYSKYVPLLLQEIKALRARVAVLEARETS